MSPELHSRVRELFDQALDKPADERAPFLEAARAVEPEIAAAVERLLDAHQNSAEFLGTNLASRKLGRYLITGELGQGAMGIVYAAMDPAIGRKVALKVIRIGSLANASAAFLQERLFQEARSIGRLSHPGIVVVYDVGQDGELAYIAMEMVEGYSLHQILASHPRLDPSEALVILRQAATALDYAHRNGIVHRDIKPANILLHNGSSVKIADFGIAKVVSPDYQTASGITLGTPAYMSPEQIGGRKVDARADQFSLGVLAYEILVGVRPFQADSVPTLAHKIVYGDCPSAHAAHPTLSLPTDDVFRKVLAKRPDDRYQSCFEFVEALAGALETLPAAIRRRSRWIMFAACGLAAALILSGSIWRYYSASPPGLPRVAGHAPLVANPPAPSPPAASPPAISPAAAGARHTAIASPVNLPNSVAPRKAGLSSPELASQLYAQGLAKREQGQSEEAFSLFRQAAGLGDPRAMVELGTNDLESDNQDKNEALLWFRKAAEAGDNVAMLNLGAMYHLGNGVPKDYELAVSWYQRAAQSGNPAAMYNLARMYETARGVAMDLAKARELYRTAAALGNASAKARLAQLAAGAK